MLNSFIALRATSRSVVQLRHPLLSALTASTILSLTVVQHGLGEGVHQPASKHYTPSYDERHARAGNALSVAPWAQPTYGPNYRSYYVGGGLPQCWFPSRIQGEPPYLYEGTWGRDYARPNTSVELMWTHGQLYQGGTGQYEPDHRNFPFGLRYGRWRRR